MKAMHAPWMQAISYGGSNEDWDAYSITSDNAPLLAATLYLYSEETPITEGNFWHYGENGEILIWD